VFETKAMKPHTHTHTHAYTVSDLGPWAQNAACVSVMSTK